MTLIARLCPGGPNASSPRSLTLERGEPLACLKIRLNHNTRVRLPRGGRGCARDHSPGEWAFDRVRLLIGTALRSMIWRAGIELLTADGLGTSEVMRRAGIS